MPTEICTCADGMLFGQLFVLFAALALAILPWAYGAWRERRAVARLAALDAGSTADASRE